MLVDECVVTFKFACDNPADSFDGCIFPELGYSAECWATVIALMLGQGI